MFTGFLAPVDGAGGDVRPGGHLFDPRTQRKDFAPVVGRAHAALIPRSPAALRVDPWGGASLVRLRFTDRRGAQLNGPAAVADPGCTRPAAYDEIGRQERTDRFVPFVWG